MNVLIVTKLFPNTADPLAAPFNRQQFVALAQLCNVQVLATLPWYPGAHLLQRWSSAGKLTSVPHREVIDGLVVEHPRVFYIPKIGLAFAGLFYALSILPRLLRRRPDVILAAWAYPDGVACTVVGQLLRVPVVVKVHGSDIDLLGTRLGPRANMRWVLPWAERIVAVSRSLADSVAKLGYPSDRISVIPNGIDTDLFCPRPIEEARRILGRSHDLRKWFLFVGHIAKDKGIFEFLRAFARLAAHRSDIAAVFVGKGPDLSRCQLEAIPLGDRVIFTGARQLSELPMWMAAAHAIVLPSHHEGIPNVLLEAQACGRWCIATSVGGIPEIISPKTGELVPAHDVAALEGALERAANLTYEAAELASGARRQSWCESAKQLHAVLALAAGPSS